MRINNLDYNNCSTNIANSILKYFGEKTLNNTMEYIDEILEEKKPKNVVLILCDGLGFNILKRTLPHNSFLVENNKKVYSAVFPPTTTAATTSLITGLNPNQHGWLGWDNYFKPIDQVVTMYTNKIKDTNVDAGSENVAYKYFPYKTIFDYINETGKYQATMLSPFALNKYVDLDDLCMKIRGLCNLSDKNYIYAYYENPDALMHITGTNSNEVIANINMLNHKLEELCNDLTDTIIIITADHGHKNSTYFVLDDYPKIKECLIRNTSIDSRASMFFIKEDKKDDFKRIFYETFGDYFILMDKEDILESELFGPGECHELFNSCLGDFIAISTADKSIKCNRDDKYHVSSHAGNTNDETLIPLIVIDKTQKSE